MEQATGKAELSGSHYIISSSSASFIAKYNTYLKWVYTAFTILYLYKCLVYF